MLSDETLINSSKCVYNKSDLYNARGPPRIIDIIERLKLYEVNGLNSSLASVSVVNSLSPLHFMSIHCLRTLVS